MSTTASQDTPTTQSGTTDNPLKVVVYSSDRAVRDQIRLALGRKIASDLPEIEIFEFATPAALIRSMDNEPYDVAILDGESQPLGGMGVAHQMKDEIPQSAPVVLLVARQQDAWMAAWSQAEAITPYPIDPVRLPTVVADVVRNHRAGVVTALTVTDAFEPGQSSRHPASHDDGHDIPGPPGSKNNPSKLM